jgi:hypothetical protein
MTLKNKIVNGLTGLVLAAGINGCTAPQVKPNNEDFVCNKDIERSNQEYQLIQIGNKYCDANDDATKWLINLGYTENDYINVEFDSFFHDFKHPNFLKRMPEGARYEKIDSQIRTGQVPMFIFIPKESECVKSSDRVIGPGFDDKIKLKLEEALKEYNIKPDLPANPHNYHWQKCTQSEDYRYAMEERTKGLIREGKEIKTNDFCPDSLIDINMLDSIYKLNGDK